MTVYVDENWHCHVENADDRQAIEDEFFDGRAPEVIEGYLCILGDNSKRTITPWKLLSELDAIQRQYNQALLAQYEQALTSIEQAVEATS